VPANRQSGGPEDLRDAAVGVGVAADQLQTLRLWEAVHQRKALAESHRVDRQAVLVDQAVADQAVRDAGAAEDSSSSGARESRALLQVTSDRLWEKTTLGRVFISTAIGLSEPGQPWTMSS
jgi:hypothetical protein